MAGEDPLGLFDAEADFYEPLLEAMTMGMPNGPDEQVEFHFAEVVDHDTPADAANQPYALTTPSPTDATVEIRPPARIVCTVAWAESGVVDETRLGTLDRSKGQLVILGPQWPEVADFIHVVIGGDRYKRGEHIELGVYEAAVHLIDIEAAHAR